MTISKGLRRAGWAFVLLTFCQWAQAERLPALPAPNAPPALYRASIAGPELVFKDGFRTWANMSDGDAPTDLLAHLAGWALPLGGSVHSNWLSAQEDPGHCEHWMSTMTSGVAPPYIAWLYEIQPSAHAYSVDWALQEYLVRDPPAPDHRVQAAQVVNNMAMGNRGWVVEGGIQAPDVIRARRYDYDAVRRAYISSTHVVPNPNYIATTAPAPSTANPLDLYDFAAAGVAQNNLTPLDPAVIANGTVPEPTYWTQTCFGGAHSAGTRRKRSGAGEEGKKDEAGDEGEANDVAAISPPKCIADLANQATPVVLPKLAKPRPSVMAFKVGGKTRCLAPGFFTGLLRAVFVACDKKSPRMEFDEYKRIYLRWQKNDWCLAAPQSIKRQGSEYWDYARFEPCVVNSDAQKWSVLNGQLLAYKGNFPLQEYKGASIISLHNDGNAIKVSRKTFSAGFFKAHSPARSFRVELGMGWDWKNKRYYSTTAGTAPWSYYYQQRSYYDYQRQTISFIDLDSTRSYSSSPPQRYCLDSKQYSSPPSGWVWDWTRWSSCNDEEIALNSQKWKFSSKAQAVSNSDQVEWLDLDGNKLWVQATNNQVAGSYFTTSYLKPDADYLSSSTFKFGIRSDAIRFGVRYAPQ